jgi:hypothetical protein
MSEIPYIQIAPVATSKVQFVSSFMITADKDQKTAKYLILKIAVDSDKTDGVVEIPIFISSNGKYPNWETERMQQEFRSGEPFVSVEIANLIIYKKESLYGFGTSFSIVDNPLDFIEEEDAL